jgi:hypothetical protein
MSHPMLEEFPLKISEVGRFASVEVMYGSLDKVKGKE